MVKYLHVIFTLICVVGAPSHLLAQSEDEVNFLSAELDEANNTIAIKFELISGKSSFNVSLYYSNDGGATFKGPVEKIRVSGDVGPGVRPGENTIYWNYFYEDDEFTGKNLVFKIRAEESIDYSQPKLMGPKAALYSIAIPGWGDSKVREGSNYWLITAGVWGMLGTSILLNSSAKQNYIDYLEAQTVEEADISFKKADNRNNTSRILGRIAFVAWAVDVAGVFIKGKKNQNQGLVQVGRTEWNLTFDHVQGNPTGGLSVRF